METLGNQVRIMVQRPTSTSSGRNPTPYVLIIMLTLLFAVVGQTSAQDKTTATPDVFAAAPHGTVVGSVTNGTAASTIPSDLKVNLLINHNNATVKRFETQADANGNFQFTDVPIVLGYDYVAATSYRDRIFNSAFAVGNASKTNLILPITIYELTEDPSVLSIGGSEAQINVQGNTLEVRQILHFLNSSDRLYTTSKDLGDGRYGSVLISLPPGAQVVSLNNENRYIVSTSDFTILDTTAVLPGDNHIIVIAYIIPYDGNAALIEQPVNYPFEGTAKLLLAQTSLKINSQQLATRSSQAVAESVYQRYEGNLKLKSGEVIRYEINGSAGASNLSAGKVTKVSAGGNSTMLFILTALIGIGVLATIAALILRQRQNRPAKPAQLIDALSRQIALLDQKHAAGQLPHDLWHQQRRPLQARLDELRGK